MIWALVAGVGVGALAAVLWLRRAWLVVTVVGSSMQPTLRPGDRVLVRRAPRRIRVGQIVVHAMEPQLVIKRVAAVPGDPVPTGLAIPPGDRVPRGRLVLLGDNPDHSLDSRALGYYDRADLVGVVVRPLSASTGAAQRRAR
jgi:signal peptidase I